MTLRLSFRPSSVRLATRSCAREMLHGAQLVCLCQLGGYSTHLALPPHTGFISFSNAAEGDGGTDILMRIFSSSVRPDNQEHHQRPQISSGGFKEQLQQPRGPNCSTFW
jgi:hypothetical protein